jgi:hypothetical protein
MAYLLKSKGWALQVPVSWKSVGSEHLAELSPYFEADTVLLMEALGCLDFVKDEMGAIAIRRAREECASFSKVRLGDFAGFYSSCVREDTAFRKWRLFCDGIFLNAVYACRVSRQGKHDVTVDEMLRTLRYLRVA